jgi:integrase
MTRRGPHEGSIHQRGDGRWAGSLHVGWIDGKRVRKHVLAHTRAEAVARLDELRRQHLTGMPIPDQRTKVGPYLETWLADVAKPRVRASTYESYRDIVTLHLVPGLGRIVLAKLSPADVQGFLNRKAESGLSPRRVAMLHGVLRTALRTAERWGYVTRNVARLVDVPKARRPVITPLSPEQAKALIEASADDRFLALWVTALATGLRQGELLGLRWADVDLDAGRVTVRHTLGMVDGHLVLLEPKTPTSRRTVMLPETAVSGLRAHRTRQLMERLVAGSRWTDSGQVFTTTVGTPLHASRVSRAFHVALERAGLPSVRFHDLRHSTATYLLSRGMTLQDVKEQLGHSTIVLTSNTYGHLLDGRRSEMARELEAVLGG